jgi:hypothetical protein
MTDRKSTSPATRSRVAPHGCVAEEQGQRGPSFSRFTVQVPVKMTVGDWISLAGLAISLTGFSIVIWRSIRSGNGSHARYGPSGQLS